MGSRCLLAAFLLGLLLANAAPASDESEEPKAGPLEAGVTERTGRVLAQLDLSVRGPAKVLATLTPADFQVAVGGRPIEEFFLDRVCSDPATTAADDPTPTSAAAAVANIAGTHFLFYFDQHHLTPEGHRRSLALSRRLIPEIIHGPNVAMVVSAGQDVRTFADWTNDHEALLRALDEIEKDPTHADPYPALEDFRVERVVEEMSRGRDNARFMSTGKPSSAQGDPTLQRMMGSGSVSGSPLPAGTDQAQSLNDSLKREAAAGGRAQASGLARSFQREDQWNTQRALSRFSMVLARMAELPPPRAAIYFADTMRSRAGDHYLELLGESADPGGRGVAYGASTLHSVGNKVSSFDGVINEASAHGVRLYTVQAQGLVGPTTMPTVSASAASLVPPMSSRARIREAQNSLVGMAAETGGRAFLNGISPAKMVRHLQSDLECFFLLSFDPSDLGKDRPLPVLVHVNRSGVDVLTRGRIVLQSDASRLNSRLLAAFTSPGRDVRAEAMQALVIPTGFGDGKFTGLVQVAVPPAETTEATWDFGVSRLSAREARKSVSGRIALSNSDKPVVFESEMEFGSGQVGLVAVAHESATDRIASREIELNWPDPEDASPSVGPIALLQPAEAAFIREGTTRKRGALGRASRTPIRTGRDTALIGVVCRGELPWSDLRVTRQISGETSVDFPPMSVEPDAEPCIVFSDLIRAGTMTPGGFTYEVRIVRDDEELGSGFRTLAAIDD